METNNIVILNDEHPDFKRLYWDTDKEKIKHILSRVNVKYLRGLIRQFILPHNDWDTIAAKDLRLFIRYDGYCVVFMWNCWLVIRNSKCS